MNNEIFITGGTGLLGKEIADRLMKDGFDVISTTTTDEKVGEYSAYGQKLTIRKVNFLDNGFVGQIEKIFEKSGNIMAIINNARSLKFLETDRRGFCKPDDLMNEFKINVVVPYQISMLGAELVGNLETIINIGSQYASRVPNPNIYDEKTDASPIQYNVSKAALNKITKELAVRFADKKIRVNCIEYGGIVGRAPKSFVSRYNDKVPHGRMLDVKECYGPIKMLLDPDNTCVNGAILEANAGWTIC
tara:strand:- start:218 stop:958 length:741 start_codon:yes stop_codon:yes gene_type:complete